MKAAIVGCGKIAYWHIKAISTIQDVEICAVSDRDPYVAQDVAGRIGSEVKAYPDLRTLVAHETPTAVHILTPPDAHAELAIQAAEAGCHVLVEKPMAVSTDAANQMLAAAQRHHVRLCVNHNYLFKPSVLKLKAWAESGVLGDIVLVNAYYGLSGEGNAYGSSGGRAHWAWQLPGGVFANFLPHLLYLQLAFLSGDITVAGVSATPIRSAQVPYSELAVLLQGETASATATISMQAKPYAKFIEIYGTRGTARADLVREVCTLHLERRLPRMVSKAVYSMEDSVQLASGTVVNTAKVFSGRLPNMPGLHTLVAEFYNALRTGQPVPVPGEQGLRLAELMDTVWTKIPSKAAPRETPAAVSVVPQSAIERQLETAGSLKGKKILVTGATGFLGSHLVPALAHCGAEVSALARHQTGVAGELQHHARIVCGNIRDIASLRTAFQDMDVVCHCAALTTNQARWAEHLAVNVQGTANVLQAALEAGVKQVIHISSVVVYGLQANGHQPLEESAPYAADPDQWAHYLRSKLEADRLALEFAREHSMAVTVLRLGILYGPGTERTPDRGLTQLGMLRLVVGWGHNHLPFTYVGNAVDGILLAAASCPTARQVFNVVDTPQITLRGLIAAATSISGERIKVLPIPARVLSGIARLLESRSNRRAGNGLPPKITRYVVHSACRDIIYSTSRIQEELGWRPGVSLVEGLQKTLNLPV